MGMFKPIVALSLGVSAVLTGAPAQAEENSYSLEGLLEWYGPGLSKRYVHTKCQNAKTGCGIVTFINAGVYIANSVQLRAHTTQPDYSAISDYCDGFDKKFSADLKAGQYYVFVVPASCNYVLKVNIKSGPTKKRDVFLVPNCEAQTWVEGSIVGNNWGKSINWMPDTRPDGAGKTPKDDDGNKCTVT